MNYPNYISGLFYGVRIPEDATQNSTLPHPRKKAFLLTLLWSTEKTIRLLSARGSLFLQLSPCPKQLHGGFSAGQGTLPCQGPPEPVVWSRFPVWIHCLSRHTASLNSGQAKTLSKETIDGARLIWDFSYEVIPKICKGNKFCQVPRVFLSVQSRCSPPLARSHTPAISQCHFS